MIPGMGSPTESLYQSLSDLPHAVKIAWLEAQGRPEAAEEILAGLVADVRRVTQVSALHLREASERAARRENAADRATAAAERRIERALADMVSVRMADELDPHGFYVYCLWGTDDNRPLYVGLSSNLLSRLGTHMADRTKRHATRRISVIRCRSEIHMQQTEGRLIAHYQPPLNTIGIRPIEAA